MQQLLALLSPLEQQQVTHYVHLDDQKRSLISRLMQRACASQVLGVPWHTIDIARTAGNRPYIANAVHRPNAPNFNYNVSHEVGQHTQSPTRLTDTHDKHGLPLNYRATGLCSPLSRCAQWDAMCAPPAPSAAARSDPWTSGCGASRANSHPKRSVCNLCPSFSNMVIPACASLISQWETVQGAGPDEADKERVFRQFWCLKEVRLYAWHVQ